MKYKNNLDIKMHNGDGMTYGICKDGKIHNWIFLKRKRIGPYDNGPEDMYTCVKCGHPAYASEINYPIQSHREY